MEKRYTLRWEFFARMRKSLLIVLWMLFFPLLTGAQEVKPIIRFSPFYTKGIGFEDAQLIQSLIQSYLSDFAEVVSAFDDSSAEALQDFGNQAPNYVLSGSIYLERDTRIFTLEIYNTQTGETLSVTSTHKTVSDLVLKAHFLVEAAFNPSGQALVDALPGETPEIPKEEPEIITGNSIAGTWRGEIGIETIYLSRQGRGKAFFSSGAQMDLSYTIENNTLKIRQDSPNTARYYYPLPGEAARQLSAKAEPMTWELSLYRQGTRLKGVRIVTDARMEENVLVELLPGSARETEWIRSR
jgi:hypothetical protein